jgi:hypothetical protein
VLAGKVNEDWRRSVCCWFVESPADREDIDGGDKSAVKEDLRVLEDPLRRKSLLLLPAWKERLLGRIKGMGAA